MSGYLSTRDATRLTRDKLRGEGRDPAQYDVMCIVREAFLYHGDLGRELNPEAWEAAVSRHRTVLDCGHGPTETDGLGTGIARDPETGREMCYPCADAEQREKLKTEDVFTGYVNEAKRVITTWPGGELARITHLSKGAERYTPNGGRYRMRTVEAVAPDGSKWKGRGGDAMDVITMRRVKG